MSARTPSRAHGTHTVSRLAPNGRHADDLPPRPDAGGAGAAPVSSLRATAFGMFSEEQWSRWLNEHRDPRSLRQRAASAWHRLSDPEDTVAASRLAALLLLCEAVLCALIIWRVPYTEIDWQAYMEQVVGFQKGERDYRRLRGGTGPLVYPAGFVYFYSLLHILTGGGQILAAQAAFAVFYLAIQAIVMKLYIGAKATPPWVLVLLCLSKRLHSIFVLRLFNDGIAMLAAYAATISLVRQRWWWALMGYSAAVAVKMNVLLMAPPVLLVMMKAATVGEIVRGAASGVIFQVCLAAPFLLHNASAYVSRAFELSRVFQYVWTVNLKFLPERLFLSRGLAAGLLAAHLALLFAFAQYRWCRDEGGLGGLAARLWQRSRAKPRGRTRTRLRNDHMLLLVFSGNFIGIVCARTLHYQFYAWYYHSIPFLLWQTRLPTAVRLGIWATIEAVWNVYPSTALSSAALLVAHGILMAALWSRPTDSLSAVRKVPTHSQ